LEQVIIEISEYPEYWMTIAEKLKTSNINELYQKHRAYCANCGSQFTKDALQHLSMFGQGSQFGGRGIIMGASQQGNAFRSGKCPACGHTKMRISIDT
jgi:hypothetical protein